MNNDTLSRRDTKGISLLFLGGDRLLPDIVGGGFAGKYWTQNNQAFGFGVILNLSASDQDLLFNNLPKNDDSVKKSLIGINVFTQYQWHFPINANVSPFLAPGLAYGRINDFQRTKNGEQTKIINHVAATLGFGIEYFFTSYFSLSLSSALVGRYSISNDKVQSLRPNNDDVSVRNEKSWYFGTNTVACTISFYF